MVYHHEMKDSNLEEIESLEKPRTKNYEE